MERRNGRRAFLRFVLLGSAGLGLYLLHECEGGADAKPVFLPPTVDKYYPLFKEESEKYNIPPQIPAILGLVESGYSTKDVVSSAGAIGIMQIMPTTAEFIASEMNLKSYNLNDPNTNIQMGIKYLDMRKNYRNGNLWQAVCDYYGKCEGYTDTWVQPMYNERNNISSPTFKKFITAVNNIGGGLVRRGFEEQGMDYDRWYSNYLKKINPNTNKNPVTQDQSTNNNCIIIEPDSLPGLINPGQTFNGVLVVPGDTASEIWNKQGKPETMEWCR